MFRTTIIDVYPLWVVFLASTLLIALASEIGFLLGRRKLSSLAPGESSNVGGAVTATLGLLAFMLAFTFSAGTDKWDTKKQLLLKESNALSTAFIRTELLPEPHRHNLQNLMSRYLDHYLDTIQQEMASDGTAIDSQMARQVEEDFAIAKKFHGEMWHEAMLATQQQPTPLTGLFISALNEALDIRGERMSVAIQQRMPMIVWIILGLLACFAPGLAGYDLGVTRGARNLSGWVVALAFASVVTLVVILDRPLTSVISHLPLIDLQGDIHKALELEPY